MATHRGLFQQVIVASNVHCCTHLVLALPSRYMSHTVNVGRTEKDTAMLLERDKIKGMSDSVRSGHMCTASPSSKKLKL
eukprot:scaffold222_cov469-Pavlova_lutheri.AAC.1